MKLLTDILKKYAHQKVIHEHLIEHGISITKSPLRVDSDSYLELVECARELYENGLWTPDTSTDQLILEKLDTGKMGILISDSKRRTKVKLDLPIENTNRSKDHKRFVVYRATDKKDEETGLPIVKKIKFSSWDSKLDINNDDEGAVKSFWARQQCDKKTNPDTAGWWACYTPELFGDKLKLRGGKSRW